MPELYLARHNESAFHGNATGCAEARIMAQKLAGVHLDKAYISQLIRAIEFLRMVLQEMKQPNVPVIETFDLTERGGDDPQDLIKTTRPYSDDLVRLWRRRYDVTPPNGESLKELATRVRPFFNGPIRNDLYAGLTVLVMAQENSLRIIAKDLDGLSDEDIVSLTIAHGEVDRYRVDSQGRVVAKTILERCL